MEPVYVIGGKLGDVLSVIAIAQSQTATPQILTSQQYGSQINIPGVTLYLYDGAWDDLAGMIKFARARFRKVIVPQTYGKDFPIRHSRPSFQLDSAARCGVDKHGTNFVRLKVDRPTKEKRKAILLADHSESSPFPHREDLRSLLKEQFQSHEIVLASEIKLPKFTDFLGIYDEMEAIVTIDTAHLHLSSATETPVFAFAWDQPVRWRGSAWHPRFKFYCRYSDYQSRKDQFINALRMTLDGRSSPTLEFIPTAYPNGYNPSIARFRGNVVRAYRFHPDPKLWPTNIAIDGNPLVLPDSLKNCSVEDPRLFTFQDKLWVSYVFVPYPTPKTPPTPCGMGYGELVESNGTWKLAKHIQPKIGKNDLSAQEKNWVFFEHDSKLHCIYQCSPKQIIYELHGDIAVRDWHTQSPVCAFGEPRGGTQPIDYQGQWLRFFHTLAKTQNQEVSWHYHLGALLMDREPPFTITKVSKVPILSGDERYFDWKFYKTRCLLPYGAVTDGSGWRVAVGINDSACADALITQDHLNL